MCAAMMFKRKAKNKVLRGQAPETELLHVFLKDTLSCRSIAPFGSGDGDLLLQLLVSEWAQSLSVFPQIDHEVPDTEEFDFAQMPLCKSGSNLKVTESCHYRGVIRINGVEHLAILNSILIEPSAESCGTPDSIRFAGEPEPFTPFWNLLSWRYDLTVMTGFYRGDTRCFGRDRFAALIG
ncbi:hypothetical protein Trydic_g23791 [Trypoxylus dichotomus]